MIVQRVDRSGRLVLQYSALKYRQDSRIPSFAVDIKISSSMPFNNYLRPITGAITVW